MSVVAIRDLDYFNYHFFIQSTYRILLQGLLVYGFLLLSNMVPFSSQMFLSALYVCILVTS